MGGYDYWVIKLDSIGNIQWQNTIGGNGEDALFSIQQTTDKGFILGGSSGSSISGDKTENVMGLSDCWILKLDSLGIIQWQKTIGGSKNDDILSIKETLDGGFVFGGSSQSPISGDKTETCFGDYDYWIVKLNPLSVGINEVTTANALNIFPNPAKGQLNIRIANQSNQLKTISIIDALGNIIYKTETTENQIVVNTNAFVKGMYVLKVNTQGKLLTEKIWIE